MCVQFRVVVMCLFVVCLLCGVVWFGVGARCCCVACARAYSLVCVCHVGALAYGVCVAVSCVGVVAVWCCLCVVVVLCLVRLLCFVVLLLACCVCCVRAWCVWL